MVVEITPAQAERVERVVAAMGGQIMRLQAQRGQPILEAAVVVVRVEIMAV